MAQTSKAFYSTNAMNNGKNENALLGRLVTDIENYANSGDWTDLAWALHYNPTASKNKRIAAIIEAVCGLTFKENAKQPSGYRAMKSKETERVDRLELLASYHKTGVSYMSDTLTNDDGLPALLEESVKAAKVRTVEEIILAAVRKARKDQPELATNVRLLSAMSDALNAD